MSKRQKKQEDFRTILARSHKHRTYSQRMVNFGLPLSEMIERLQAKGQSRPRATYEASRAKLRGKRPYSVRDINASYRSYRSRRRLLLVLLLVTLLGIVIYGGW